MSQRLFSGIPHVRSTNSRPVSTGSSPALARHARSRASASDGTPGTETKIIPRDLRTTPGAIPTGFSTGSAPAGMSAWTSADSGMSSDRDSYLPRIIPSASRLLASSTDAATATPSSVMSSSVGPSPPVVIRSLPGDASDTSADATASAVSGTVRHSVTARP
jgi:hypothetical protein